MSYKHKLNGLISFSALLLFLFQLILKGDSGITKNMTFRPNPENERMDTLEQTTNKAVQVNIQGSSFHQELEGQQAPPGWTFILLETRWVNIHPKQKMDKEKLEKKKDHTMGVKLLTEKKKEKKEYVEVDVAYMVRKLSDHIYCLADGLAYSLHPLTEEVPGGTDLKEAFVLPKHGDVREIRFVFLLPKDAENLGFQFFDYEYGHILIPIQGDLQQARGTGGPPGKVLSQIKGDLVEVAAHSVAFVNEYQEEPAPEGWHYTKVHISGKSLSGKNIKDIVQIDPEEYIWITADGGYLYYAVGGTTTDAGFIRFTPEVYQSQEVVFLVPSSAKIEDLGIRVQNKVFSLPLESEEKINIPPPLASHRDGDTMEIMIFDIKREGSTVLIDLGIQSLVGSGMEIMKEQQFILVSEDEKIYVDDELTSSLFHRPPDPFIVPPEKFVRFQLAYEADFLPSVLYFRGFESEKNIDLSPLKK